MEKSVNESTCTNFQIEIRQNNRFRSVRIDEIDLIEFQMTIERFLRNENEHVPDVFLMDVTYRFFAAGRSIVDRWRSIE